MNPHIPVEAQHVLVVGLGTSGQATVRYLLAHADDIGMQSLTLVDSAQTQTLKEYVDALRQSACLQGIQITACLGKTVVPNLSEEQLYDICVITPGLAPHTSLSKSAYQKSKEVLSEIELAYRLSSKDLIWIAVTGTNGKTTTVEMIQSVLNAPRERRITSDSTLGQAYSVGNIGLPVFDVLDDARPGDFLVAEISSFQAARLSKFCPEVAVLLNLSSDHLDWHGDIANYGRDKCKIFANSAAGNLVLMPEPSYLHSHARPCIEAAAQAAAEQGARVVAVTLNSTTLPLPVNELGAKGTHNLINACFATEIARHFGISDADIASALRGFHAGPHRMQEVGDYNDILYIDDSKSTNPDAAIQALTAYPGREIILLLGGQNKGADLLDLARVALGRAKMICCFGQARHELQAAFDACGDRQAGGQVQPMLRYFDSMLDAVSCAHSHAVAGDVVLFSPANASYDEFDNYSARGTAFAQFVSSQAAPDQCLTTPGSRKHCNDR
ncbi:MAG: UDP-N-acetylmuramoyl-L-alanine--D-glutamate ligase [Coriobacteriia bacterium]|nr:UDP-N-acetylmuramoyl-L-alanine--D-glutamate ligase [Coriobacteriia bacterium]